MSKYLLGIAAVNLYGVFSQSDNISMFRGASLALRDAAHLPTPLFQALSVTVEEVSIGASEGIYELEACESDVIHLINNIKTYLSTDFNGYTFVVDFVTQSTDFVKDKRRLSNKLRYLQQHQTRLSLTNSETDQVCQLTNLLPAETTVYIQGEKQRSSTIAKRRFEKGRDDKQVFYNTELKKFDIACPVNTLFTNDVIALSENLKFKRLNRKLAYIYLDGNKFSAIQREVVNDVNSQRAFDKDIQEKRAQLLSHLLERCANDVDWQTAQDEIRLETLLWGGDEILFIVPAWKAFDTVAAIFDFTRDWQFKGHALTHALGMVLCKCGMPVFRMRQLAQLLADNQKELAKNDAASQINTCSDARIPGTTNVYDFLVLESEDFAEDTLQQHFNVRYGQLAPLREHVLIDAISAEQLDTIRTKLNFIRRSQIYLLANSAITCTDYNENGSSYSLQEQRFVQVHDEISLADFIEITKQLALLLLGFKSDELYTEDKDVVIGKLCEQRRGLTWLVVSECMEYVMPVKEYEA